MTKKVKYTAEVLIEAVANSYSIADVQRYLGKTPGPGLGSYLRSRFTFYGIDTSHFDPQRWSRGSISRKRKTPDEVLVLLPDGSGRPSLNQLIRSLLEVGVPHKCAGCGNAGEWCDQPLTLEVDHIDGNYLNNLQSNLRFLCPNCHSQTPTHRFKNRKHVR